MAITVLQRSTLPLRTSFGSGSPSFTLDASTTDGSTVVVVINSYHATSGQISGVTIGGIAATMDGEQASGTSYVSVWRLSNVSAGVNTIVITPVQTTGHFITANAIEVSGLTNDSPVGSVTYQTSSGSTVSVPTPGLATIPQLAVGLFMITAGASNNGVTLTQGTAIFAESDSNTYAAGGAAHRVAVSPAGTTLAWTTSTSPPWQSVVVTYKAVPEAGAAFVPGITVDNETVFVPATTESLGASSAGAVPKLNDEGKIDPSMLAAPSLGSTTALAIVSNSVAIDLALGDYFTLTVSANITSMTLVNPPAAGQVRQIFLRVTRDSVGSRTFTLPVSWTAAPHSAPGILTDFVAGANKVTDIHAWTLDGVNWSFFIEPRHAGTGVLGNGYIPRFSSATDLVDSPIWANSLGVAIGTNTIPPESRLFVYGGLSGAHIDVRGEPGFNDQAIVDLQGSDFDPEARSLFLRYSGVDAFGTIAGFPAQNLAEITSAGDTFFIRNLFNVPIRFIVDGVEVFQATKTGITSALDIIAPNLGAGGLGTGDVVGPGSAVDEALPRFDGTTGRLLQSSSVRVTDNGSIIIPENSNPTPASAGELKLFAREVAGRIMPASVGPSGLDSVLQPLLARNKVGYWCPSGNAVAAPGIFGFTAPTVTGFTATARNVATTNRFTRMRRIGYVTAATAGTVGHWRVNAYQYTVGGASENGGFFYVKRFGISDAAAVATARMFIGMRSSSTPANVEPSTLTNCIGVGHNAAHTNLHIFYGGSAAQTPIDLGASFPITHGSVEAYELALFSAPNSGDVHWQVTRLSNGTVASGTIVNSGATVLPTETTLLAPWGYRTNNATALAVGLDVMSAYIETDF